MNLEAIKQEVPNKAQFELALKVAVAEYTQAAIDEGVTADKAQRLLRSAKVGTHCTTGRALPLKITGTGDKHSSLLCSFVP